MKQCENRNCASLIEKIDLCQHLPMQCIFKGKKYLDKWYSALEPCQSHQISFSDNKWTDGKLRLDWLQTFFELCTASYLQETY